MVKLGMMDEGRVEFLFKLQRGVDLVLEGNVVRVSTLG
jgi:hypothetical protein